MKDIQKTMFLCFINSISWNWPMFTTELWNNSFERGGVAKDIRAKGYFRSSFYQVWEDSVSCCLEELEYADS